MNKFKDTLTRSADATARTVAETVKSNPIPIALVGAGVALYLYNRSRGGSQYPEEEDFRDYRFQGSTENDFGWDERREASGSVEPSQGSSAGQKVGQRLQEVGERVRDEAKAAVDATRDMGAQVAERSRQLYRDSRDRVASTIESHPLETGLMLLALGLVAGVALPTSAKVRRQIRPQARALRRRAGSVMSGGRQVLRRATEAARDEAKSQGLTLESKSKQPQQVETRAESP